jgi:molybdenum cofactor guanylyltransferase
LNRLLDTVGVILAGGAGSRLGGRKAWAQVRGRPMIAHVADCLSPQVARLAVVAESDAAALVAADALADPGAPGLGPLAGLAAGLAWGASLPGVDWVLLVPCDMPDLPGDLAFRLRRAVGGGVRTSFAQTDDGPQPLVSLWHVSLAHAASAALGGGHASVRRLLCDAGAIAVRFDDPEPFINVNTPTDLARVERRLVSRLR